jgi:hypothetical protein
LSNGRPGPGWRDAIVGERLIARIGFVRDVAAQGFEVLDPLFSNFRR